MAADKKENRGLLKVKETKAKWQHLVGTKVETKYYDRDGKLFKTISTKALDKETKVFTEYRDIRKNEKRIEIARVKIPYIGILSAWKYKDNDLDTFMGIIQPDGKHSYTILEQNLVKRMQSFIMTVGNAVGHVGEHSPKAMEKRIELYKDKNRELRRREKKAMGSENEPSKKA